MSDETKAAIVLAKEHLANAQRLVAWHHAVLAKCTLEDMLVDGLGEQSSDIKEARSNLTAHVNHYRNLCFESGITPDLLGVRIYV